MFLWAIDIFPRSVCLFCCRKIGGPIMWIYGSLRDTWMGLRPRNSFCGNTEIEIYLQCRQLFRTVYSFRDLCMCWALPVKWVPFSALWSVWSCCKGPFEVKLCFWPYADIAKKVPICMNMSFTWIIIISSWVKCYWIIHITAEHKLFYVPET